MRCGEIKPAATTQVRRRIACKARHQRGAPVSDGLPPGATRGAGAPPSYMPPDDAGALVPELPDVPDPPELPGLLAGLLPVAPGAGVAAGMAGVVVVVVVLDSGAGGLTTGGGAAGAAGTAAGAVVVVVVLLVVLVPLAAGSLLALRLQPPSMMPATAVANTNFVRLIGAFILFPFTEIG